jgi:UDP-N-acetylmuramoylalanine--D-glutamate ligase
MTLENKNVLVLGLGSSGVEAAKLARARGASVTVRDNGDSPILRAIAEELGPLGITVELGVTAFSGVRHDLAVLSPGIDPLLPLVRQVEQAGVPVLGELEFASRFVSAPIIAITGTNGKTTTTELVAAVLTAGGRRTTACGNIGLPLSAVAAGGKAYDALVVEVSSFQLERIERFRPRVSVYLNLTPDHLNRYPSMAEYERAKWRIFENQTITDTAVVNSRSALPPMAARRVTFNAFGGPADYQLLGGRLCARGEAVCLQSETNLAGPHNAENLLAAIAVGHLLEVPGTRIVEAVRTYRPLPHRCEKIAEINGVLYVNDSKATNIDAVEKALLGQTRPVILIAGGKDKGLDFSVLTPLVKERVKHVLLIGEMRPKLRALWGGVTGCTEALSLEEAVDRGAEIARTGDVVLLSPGCSSYDMFTSFEHRGDTFRRAVLARKTKTTHNQEN